MPHFNHNCQYCHFIGSKTISTIDYDLYVCWDPSRNYKDPNAKVLLLARFGNGFSTYERLEKTPLDWDNELALYLTTGKNSNAFVTAPLLICWHEGANWLREKVMQDGVSLDDL